MSSMLGRKAFGRPAAPTAKYLEWKYLRNPYRTDPLRLRRTRPQGSRRCDARLLRRSLVDAGRRRGHPLRRRLRRGEHHRTSGVATALMQVALADLPSHGVSCVINASGGRITVLQSLAMGWKSVVAVDPLDRTVWHSALSEGLAYLRTRDSTSPAIAGGARRRRRRHHDTETRTSWRQWQPLASPTVPSATSGTPRSIAGATQTRSASTASFSRVGGTHYRLPGHRSAAPRSETLPLYVADWAGESAADQLGPARTCGGALRVGHDRVWAASVSDEERSQLERLGFEPAQREFRAHGMPCILFRAVDLEDADRAATIERSTWDVQLIDSMHG